MASQKMAMANRVGEMVVMTQAVATKELYLTMVLKGDEIWDIDAVTTPEDALMNHRKFMAMCEVFGPVADRLAQDKAQGRPLDPDAVVEELERDYQLVTQARKGMMH